VVAVVVVVVLVAISGTNEDITLLVEVDDTDEYSLDFDISSVVRFEFTLVAVERSSFVLETT
jgi:hypothetical protein